MKMQCSLTWEFMLSNFQLDHTTAKATKNICCAKDEDAVDYKTVNSLFKKFCSSRKNLNCLAQSDSPKNIKYKTILQSIEVNQVSSTQRYQANLASL